MPLNASNMVTNGHLLSADIRGFYDLLTGTMTDQPVTVSNTVQGQRFNVANANTNIRPIPGAAGMLIESVTDQVLATGATQTFVGSNLFLSSGQWQRYNTGLRGGLVGSNASNPLAVFNAPAGANPATPAQVAAIDPSGNLSTAGSVTLSTSGVSSVLQGVSAGIQSGQPNELQSNQRFFAPSMRVTDQILFGPWDTWIVRQGAGDLRTQGTFQANGGFYFENSRAVAIYFRSDINRLFASWHFRVQGVLEASGGQIVSDQYISAPGFNWPNGTWLSNTSQGNIISCNGGIVIQASTITPGYSFAVMGGAAGGVGGWNQISARKAKTAILPIDDALSVVLDDRLHGYRYQRCATDVSTVARCTPEYFGFIADDWLGVAPEPVVLADGQPHSMTYGDVVPLLFEAFKQYVGTTDSRLAQLERMCA